MAKRPEIIDPFETVDLQPVDRQNLRHIPSPALTYLISSSEPKKYPGGSLEPLSLDQLVNLASQEKIPNEYIHHRFETTPGIFNRLHLTLWNDAFPEDDREYCLKMRFAAAFLDGKGEVVARSQNWRMTKAFGIGGERLCTATTCIRDKITSRTEAVVGDCGHAYLWGINGLLESGWTTERINKLYKYEAGFNPMSKTDPNIWYEPWIGKEATYTCLYCITILGWLLNQDEVIALKDLYGNGPSWLHIPLAGAFYHEARYAAAQQGLPVPTPKQLL